MRTIDCTASTTIARIEYDPDSCVLEIQFIKEGSTYNYSDVPSHIIDELEASESKGSFCHKNIYKNFSGGRV
jgi:hypothetical protein